MASFASPNNVYEFRIRMVAEQYNQEVDLIRNYRFIESAPPTPGTTSRDILDALRADFRLYVRPVLSTKQRVVRYELRTIYDRTPRTPPVPPLPAPQYKLAFLDLLTYDGVAADVGGRSIVNDDLLPPSNSLSFQVRNDQAGRRAFGMVRIGLVPFEDVINDQVTLPALVTWAPVQGWLGHDVTVGFAGGTARPVIFNRSRYLLGLDPDIVPAHYTLDITLATLAKTLGTQRTRKAPIRRPGY